MTAWIALLVGLQFILTSSIAGAVRNTCDVGFQRQLARITIYIDKVDTADLASALSDSVKALDVCAAGDDFTVVGKWTDIGDRLERSAKK